MLTFAGCASGPSAKETASPLDAGSVHGDARATQGAIEASNESVPPPAEDTGPRVLHFEKTFEVRITHGYVQNANNHRVNLEPNCVSFGKTQVWLVFNGTAEAKWTANGPFAGRMKVDVRDVGLVATNGGSASPSVLQFGRFHAVPNAALGLIFVVQPADTGVVYQQTATLNIAFNYLGRPELKTELVPCAYT